MVLRGSNQLANTDSVELGRAYLELKQLYDDLVGRNLAGVFRTTVLGRFVECNDSMAHMLGYRDREELMGLGAKDLYLDPADRERFVSELLERKKLVNWPATLKHRNGRAVHVLENVFLNEQEGRPTTIEGTLIDVTALRATELEQRALLNNYRQLMDRVRDGILIVQNSIVVYANPAADGILGGGSGVGKRLLDRTASADHAAMLDALSAAEHGESRGPLDVRMGDDGGGWRETVLFTSPMRHEGRPAAQVTLQDVGLQQSLVQERSRARIAEQVNEVLRHEIQEHRRTQEALRQSRRFARSLVDSSLDMIMAADDEGRVTEYNPAASIRFGYEPEEMLGRNTRILYAEDGEFERVQTELNKHGAFAGEIVNVDKDGRRFTSFLAASKLYDEDGKLIGAMGVSRDITQAKRDQELLKASEERYRELFENATDLIHSIDTEGRVQYVNNAWRNTLGYGEEELASLNLLDLVVPEQREAARKWLNETPTGPSAIWKADFIAKDGRRVRTQGTSTVRVENGTISAVRSIFRDITREEEARAEVLEHEAKQRALFESSEHMFWTVDRRIALTSFNRGYSEMIERLYAKRPELNREPGTPRTKFASDDYHDQWSRRYAEAFAGKALRFETDLLDHDGQRVCNEIFLSPVFEPDGSVEEVFGIGHEITEQKEAEDLVREQAARLKAIFENSANMMIWTLDPDFHITAMNEHFVASNERGMGVRFSIGDDFIAMMMERVADQRYEPVVAKYSAALKGMPQQFEVELKNREGRSLWVESFLNPITVDGEVREISCLAYGITDKKEAQRKLLESLHEKEVLLKEVHHRVKNNLQIISSILNLQSAYVDDDPRTLALLRDSQDRIRSMSFIHESLYQNKNFSHVDLASYIDGLSRNLVMSYSLGGKVELEKALQPVSLSLDQAIPCGLILNELISNTLKHAFPEGRKGRIRIMLEARDPQVFIRIQDNGTGLPEGFDEERDANLGLQLVRTLVDQLDGTLIYEPSASSGSGGRGVAYLLTFGRIK